MESSVAERLRHTFLNRALEDYTVLNYVRYLELHLLFYDVPLKLSLEFLPVDVAGAPVDFQVVHPYPRRLSVWSPGHGMASVQEKEFRYGKDNIQNHVWVRSRLVKTEQDVARVVPDVELRRLKEPPSSQLYSVVQTVALA